MHSDKNLPRSSQTITPAVFFFGLFLFLMLAGRESFFRDPGTFWHVRTGEWILDHRQLLEHDPYTFTFGGRPWAPHQWLAEVGMALIERTAGITGLLTIAATVLAFTYTIVFTQVTRTGLHWLPSTVLTGLAIAVSATHFHARPHVLTMLFVAVTYLRLQQFETGSVRIRGLVGLIPLFILWANVHGGVLAGIGTVGLAIAGWLLFHLVGWPSPVTGLRQAGWLSAWGIAILLTMLATPYGLDLPRTWFEIMGMSELPRIIKEHAAVDLSEPSSWPFLAFAAVYLFLLAGIREKPRITWLLPLVWLVLGFERVRHTPLFAITALAAIAAFFPATIWARYLRARPDLYDPPPTPPRTSRFAITGCALLLAIALGLQLGGVRLPVLGAGWARFPGDLWPVGLIPALHREADGRTEVPIFNEYIFGGFLIYYTPEYRPFVDDRCELFGGPWLDDFVRAEYGDATTMMTRWQQEYPRFNLALTIPGRSFDRYFATQPDWELVAEDGQVGRLWRRKTEP